MNRKPTKKFIKELKDMTDENLHGECYEKIAEWCYNSSVANSLGDEVINSFLMFRDIFRTINWTHLVLGNMPYGEMRYNIGKEMYGAIRKYLGKEIEDCMNDGQCGNF